MSIANCVKKGKNSIELTSDEQKPKGIVEIEKLRSSLRERERSFWEMNRIRVIFGVY